MARPLAGALAAAAVFAPGLNADPMTLAIAGLIVGAPTALAVHGAKAGTRVAANTTTAGLAAPAVSLAEDGLTVGAVLLTFLAPLLVPLLLAILLWAAWRALRRRRARGSQAEPGAL